MGAVTEGTCQYLGLRTDWWGLWQERKRKPTLVALRSGEEAKREKKATSQD